MSNWGSPSYSQRQEPIAYIRGYGLDLTSILVLVHVGAMLLLTVALAAGLRAKCEYLFMFNTATFWQGKYWTPFTDLFYHDISGEHIFFVIAMYLFWRFGRELESLLGRASYALFYVLLVLVPILSVLIAAKFLGHPMEARVQYVGIPAHYAIFVGFCIVYPGVMFWGIAAKWVAIIYTAISTLALIAVPAPSELIPFYTCLATAYIYLHFCGANHMFDPFEWLEGWKQDRALRKFEQRQKLYIEEEEDFNEAVNPILDKIAREGIQSLTPQEKQKLERARAQLLKREKPKRR